MRKIKVVHLSFHAAMFIIGTICLSCCTDRIKESGAAGPPFGRWTRTYTGTETYHAQFNLKEDGNAEWILLDTLSTHTNSNFKFQVSGTLVRFYDDPDFSGDGQYQWATSDGILSLKMSSDSYAARISALAGNWNQVNISDYKAITGVWQRTIAVSGMSYRIKLTMTSAGVLSWEMVDPIPGHTNSVVSFALNQNTIVIYNDSDCSGNGYYAYVINNNILTISLIKDKCPPRSPSFSGSWSR